MWEEPGAGTEFNNVTSPFELRRYTELQSELVHTTNSSC